MRIYANFVYIGEGYGIEYMSTSPDEFPEESQIMYCDVDKKLSYAQVGWDYKSSFDNWKPYDGIFSIDYFKDNKGNFVDIVDVIDCEDGNYGILNITYKEGKKIKEEFISDEEVESEYVSQSN